MPEPMTATLAEVLTEVMRSHGTQALLGLPDDELDCCVEELVATFREWLAGAEVRHAAATAIGIAEQFRAETYTVRDGAAAALDAVLGMCGGEEP